MTPRKNPLSDTTRGVKGWGQGRGRYKYKTPRTPHHHYFTCALAQTELACVQAQQEPPVGIGIKTPKAGDAHLSPRLNTTRDVKEWGRRRSRYKIPRPHHHTSLARVHEQNLCASKHRKPLAGLWIKTRKAGDAVQKPVAEYKARHQRVGPEARPPQDIQATLPYHHTRKHDQKYRVQLNTTHGVKG